MRVWRICRARWAATAFDGEGARRTGGRWNHKGDAVVYAASSLALGGMELFVNLEPGDAPDDYLTIPAEIPDALCLEALKVGELPTNWRNIPAPVELQDLGSEWLRSKRSLVLCVPSAVVPEERNVLINPDHPLAGRVIIGKKRPFRFDPRMWKT